MTWNWLGSLFLEDWLSTIQDAKEEKANNSPYSVVKPMDHNSDHQDIHLHMHVHVHIRVYICMCACVASINEFERFWGHMGGVGRKGDENDINIAFLYGIAKKLVTKILNKNLKYAVMSI